MQVRIQSRMLSQDVANVLRQLEETFGNRVASMAATHPPFEHIGELCIFLRSTHPYMCIPEKGRRSFHAPTNTYFVDVSADYLSIASSDWQVRVAAYANAVSSGVGKVAKTRLTAEESTALQRVVRSACSEIAATPPQAIAAIGPVYVRSPGKTDGSILSFYPNAGMIPVMPDAIANHWPDTPQNEERLFKLYAKREGVLHYREAWFSDDRTIEEYWGICGERGELRTHDHETSEQARDTFERLKNAARAEEFRTIALGRHAKLLVEIPVKGMGSPGDLERRHALEDFLDELVGWLGLGHLDGGSSGSGTMEAMCYVVDFDIAKPAIENALRDSPFSDFARVYRER